jgi:fructoselysine-6-P-deglycase FrlB-like protein
MNIRSQIHGTPRALKETFEKGRPEYDEVVRRTSWGDGPLFIVGGGSAYPAALAGVYAFQELLGWPVVASHAENFLAYTASVLRPRSVVLVLPSMEATDSALEAARQARARGARVLVMTPDAASPLAESADGVFLIRPEEGNATGLQAELCRHTAMGFLAVVAAHVLKRHHQKLDELEREYDKLPEHAEWVLTRLSDVVRSLVADLGEDSTLMLAGGGSYYPAVLQAARALSSLTTLRTWAVDAAELAESRGSAFTNRKAILYLSGSRSRFRKLVGESAGLARQAGARVFSATDANDRQLAETSAMSVLLPLLGELPGSALALFLVQCLIAHFPRGIVRSTEQSGTKPASSQGKS